MRKIYYYSNLLNYFFWNRIAQSIYISESSLGIFRWIFGIFMLLFTNSNSVWVSQVPDAFFNPPYLSLANLFTQFPRYLVFYIIDILVIISIFFLTVGIKVRLFSYLWLICWLIGSNFRYSFGKIDHGIMHFALLTCMIFSNWGSYYALIPDRKISRNYSTKALAIFSVLLAFAMFTAGFGKALNWVDFNFSTSGFLSWFYRGYYNLNRNDLLAPIVLDLPKWIFEFADYAAVIFELSAFIVLLISRKWWLFWLLIACLFHLSNTLLLNISFITHFLVYLVFVDFSRFREQVIRRSNLFIFKKLKYSLSGFVFGLFLTHFMRKIYGQSLTFSSSPDLNIDLYNSVIIWILAAIIIFIDLFIELKKSTLFSRYENK